MLRKPRTLLLIVFAIFLAGTFIAANLYFDLYPRNRVSVRITAIPLNTVFLALTYEKGDELRNMQRVGSAFGASLGPIGPAWHGDFMNRNHPGEILDVVEWKKSDRYGVIVKQGDGSWWITWFDWQSVPIQGRRWLTGGGTVVFDLSEGRPTALPMQINEELNLPK